MQIGRTAVIKCLSSVSFKTYQRIIEKTFIHFEEKDFGEEQTDELQYIQIEKYNRKKQEKWRYVH